MSTTAVQQFRNIVKRFAGPQEQVLAQGLLGRVRVVPDSPSLRVASLIERAGVTADDKAIFGTADQLGVTLLTTDRRFNLEAQRQGVFIRHDLWVPPLQFIGQ